MDNASISREQQRERRAEAIEELRRRHDAGMERQEAIAEVAAMFDVPIRTAADWAKRGGIKWGHFEVRSRRELDVKRWAEEGKGLDDILALLRADGLKSRYATDLMRAASRRFGLAIMPNRDAGKERVKRGKVRLRELRDAGMSRQEAVALVAGEEGASKNAVQDWIEGSMVDWRAWSFRLLPPVEEDFTTQLILSDLEGEADPVVAREGDVWAIMWGDPAQLAVIVDYGDWWEHHGAALVMARLPRQRRAA